MIYRIITEDKDTYNTRKVEKLVSETFDGFSISKQKGFFKGKAEQSIVIEIDTSLKAEYIYILANAIKELLKQECVLVQTIASDSKFI